LEQQPSEESVAQNAKKLEDITLVGSGPLTKWVTSRLWREGDRTEIWSRGEMIKKDGKNGSRAWCVERGRRREGGPGKVVGGRKNKGEGDDDTLKKKGTMLGREKSKKTGGNGEVDGQGGRWCLPTREEIDGSENQRGGKKEKQRPSFGGLKIKLGVNTKGTKENWGKQFAPDDSNSSRQECRGGSTRQGPKITQSHSGERGTGPEGQNRQKKERTTKKVTAWRNR